MSDDRSWARDARPVRTSPVEAAHVPAPEAPAAPAASGANAYGCRLGDAAEVDGSKKQMNEEEGAPRGDDREWMDGATCNQCRTIRTVAAASLVDAVVEAVVRVSFSGYKSNCLNSGGPDCRPPRRASPARGGRSDTHPDRPRGRSVRSTDPTERHRPAGAPVAPHLAHGRIRCASRACVRHVGSMHLRHLRRFRLPAERQIPCHEEAATIDGPLPSFVCHGAPITNVGHHPFA